MSVYLTILKKLLENVLIVLVCFLLFLYYFQKNIIYPSSYNGKKNYSETPDKYGIINYKSIKLLTEDNIVLDCYLLVTNKTNSNKPITIVVFCPNCGNIGSELLILKILHEECNYNVFIYSYRGYGKSTGQPSESGLKLDADRIMKYLTKESEDHINSLFFLYGRSLGGAVAAYVAYKFSDQIKGVVLENTFLSIPKVAIYNFPYLKYFTFFMTEKWNIEEIIPKIKSSISLLLLSSVNDEIVPPEHMDTIYKLSISKNKQIYKLQNSNHNNASSDPNYWCVLKLFIKKTIYE